MPWAHPSLRALREPLSSLRLLVNASVAWGWPEEQRGKPRPFSFSFFFFLITLTKSLPVMQEPRAQGGQETCQSKEQQ